MYNVCFDNMYVYDVWFLSDADWGDTKWNVSESCNKHHLIYWITRWRILGSVSLRSWETEKDKDWVLWARRTDRQTDRYCDNVTPWAPDEAKNIFIEAWGVPRILIVNFGAGINKKKLAVYLFYIIPRYNLFIESQSLNVASIHH